MRHGLRGARILPCGLILVALLILSGCAYISPVIAPRKIPRIGYLSASVPPTVAPSPTFEAFRQGLRDLGYVEGETIQIESRWAEAKAERYPELVAELLQLDVDVLVTIATPGTRAAKEATSTIPIVFLSVGNPVESRLVASLSRPGGNVTGLSSSTVVLNGKRLELLKESVPGLRQVAVLVDATTQTASPSQLSTDLAPVARSLGVRIQEVRVQGANDLENAFDTMIRQGADGLLDAACPMTCNESRRVAGLAARHRLPAIYGFRTFVDAGGLMSVGAGDPAMAWRAAALVDKILKGEKPADLPVEQPTVFDLFINVKSAAALGLTIPQSVLTQATEILR